jgi:hypothetical protein
VPSTPHALLIATALIACGFVPGPAVWAEGVLVLAEGRLSLWSALLWMVGVGYGLIGPLLPFGLALNVLARGARVSPILTFGFTAALLLLGFLATLLAAAYAGPGAGFYLLSGLLVTSGVVGALLWTARDRLSPLSQDLASLGVLVSAVGAAWSLLVAPLVLVSAAVTANGNPFCLARHEEGPAPITSILDLRWFSFITTDTGYKHSSRWYFHGLLLVTGPDGSRSYNWSPRRLRFERVERPELLLVPPAGACSPV